MDGFFLENPVKSRARNRCYSSMNYQEYEDFFGTPPKMPKAPHNKPLEDPNDIPALMLEEETSVDKEGQKHVPHRTIKYKIETIPEIEGSEINSIEFQSPRNNFEFFLLRSSSKLEDGVEDPETIQPGPRRITRPRSYSQNSPLNSKLRIIDFLSEAHIRGRKMVKQQ